MEHAISCNTLSKPKLLNQKSMVKQKISFLQVCLLGFGRMMGVRCKYWNRGLAIDLTYLYIFGAFLSLHMLVLASSIAEMTGALPFTGGTYGFARGIYGPFLGFLVGILEIFTGLACMAAFIHGFGEACVTALRLPSSYILLFFLLLVVATAGVQTLDIYRFSWVIRVFTLFAAAFTLMYIFSPLATDLSEHSHYAHMHAGTTGSHAWQDILGFSPTCAFFFTGVEMLPIIAHDSRDPRRAVPRALIFVTCTSIIAMFVTYAISSHQPPGVEVLHNSPLPLSYGFANLLNISLETAMLFNIPFQISSFMVSQYFLCIILRSMAESGLLPSLFLKELSWKKYQITFSFPYYSATMTLTLSTLAAALAWLMNDVSDSLRMSFVYFFSFPYYTLYIALFLTFITFRQHFASLPRSFVSPFGVIGAYVGIAITCFFIIATCFFAYNAVALGVYLLLIAGLSVVYRYIVHRHETFSGEEEKVFFPTYVIRSNQNQQKRMRKTAAMLKNQQTTRSLHNSTNFNNTNSASYRSCNESPSNKSVSWGDRLGFPRKPQLDSRKTSPKHHSSKPTPNAAATSSSKYHPTSGKVVPVTTISEKERDRSGNDNFDHYNNGSNGFANKPSSYDNITGSERMAPINAAVAAQGNSSSTLSTYASSQSHVTTTTMSNPHHSYIMPHDAHYTSNSHNNHLLTSSILETTISTANSSNKTSIRMNPTTNNSVKNSGKLEYFTNNKLVINTKHEEDMVMTMVTEKPTHHQQLPEEDHDEEELLLKGPNKKSKQDVIESNNGNYKHSTNENHNNSQIQDRDPLVVSDLESNCNLEQQEDVEEGEQPNGEDEELTFEEALASSEDDMKLRYIRQHLHQLFASNQNSHKQFADHNANAAQPPHKNRGSVFFSSFLFPPPVNFHNVPPPSSTSPSNCNNSQEHINHSSSNNLVGFFSRAPTSRLIDANINNNNDNASNNSTSNKNNKYDTASKNSGATEALPHPSMAHPYETRPQHRASIIDALRLPLWWRTSTFTVAHNNNNNNNIMHNSFSAAVSHNSSGHSSNKNSSIKSNLSQKSSDKNTNINANNYTNIITNFNHLQNPQQAMAVEDVIDDM